ncbi:DNA-formamidopyrimidine glycosylase [Paenibacillus macquariensis]|uniref:Formamidopyrimidine-DNA glycosylase n=1 Tax=Paenibacillus macquariensis TaxID=948756 RepID=A0ABY1JXR2_9BACL|nr:DNA-formamidopyrimidine glycosylase [Paenibacillus macquariensis]MEC0089272.1 DNA-formamidopyrimidine glycosylase [Paenibacillus macquariensis]OAB33320.1 DNA-formamidopyrimidine glycosylase [Paenibacillus macquariensis subsp. macquariensis]SIQ94967.1 DNA-(apurinic or apyrimidinic site) lyase [Paenibacillus macquariensis]
MPELPEVETIIRTLNVLVKGKTIDHVSVHLARIIQRPDDIEEFAFLLQGHTILGVERRGKFIRILLDGLVIVSHLRMEGRYGLYTSEEPVEKHTHVVFHFNDGTELRYKDVRQFGTMHLFATGEDMVSLPLSKLGLEPLDKSFTLAQFKQILAGKKTKIKSVLLNQAYVVGIGNIYVDESLFKAGIHPESTTESLNDKQIERLHAAIVSILLESIEAGGSSIKSYVNGQGELGMFQQQLLVYGRQNKPCVNCSSIIEKTVVGGRGTHFCPTCQPDTK